MTKPMLASDFLESKLRFPLGAQPKIDGVRGWAPAGQLMGRSLKKFGNQYISRVYNHEFFVGFDGELAAAHELDPALCRKTTSATSTITGEPFLLWWLFDYVTESTIALPYRVRYATLQARYAEITRASQFCADHLRVVPMLIVRSLDELNDVDAKNLELGYEGTCIRDLDGLHKQGRSTAREGGLLRIKRFVEEDAIVIEIREGEMNTNEATTNELGYIERSSHMAGMVPNGLVGSLICRDVKTGKVITVSAGSMPHDLRAHYFTNQKELLLKTIKYKHFPKGVKDKPRFPTFQSLRSEADMV